MKKLLSIVLIILIAIPSACLSEIEGVTVTDYASWIKENHPGFVASEICEYKDRQLLVVGAGSASDLSVAMGYSYKNSDIIEFVTSVGTDNDFTTYTLAAMSDATTTTGRLLDAKSYIEAATADAMSFFSDKWSKKNQFGHYYLELNQAKDASDKIVWIWLHESSKQKNKSTAAGLINAENYPLLNLAMQLLNAPAAPSASPSGITLSSGEWKCPDHIPAGEYKVTPIKSASISVWRDDVLTVSEYLIIDDDDEIGRLVLKDGDMLQITGGKLAFEPFQ